MKVRGWRSALDRVVLDAAGRPFEWGQHDCCTFVGRCAEAVTGHDYRAAFPAYRDEAGAQALLDAHGGIRGLLTHAFGQPVPWETLMSGDIALINMGSPQGVQPAIVVDFYAYAPGARSLERRPTWQASCGWVL